MEDAIVLLSTLSRNLDIFRCRLGAPANADVLIRRFRSGAFESALIAIDGMVNSQLIDEMVRCAMEAQQDKDDSNYAYTSDILAGVSLGGKAGPKNGSKLH